MTGAVVYPRDIMIFRDTDIQIWKIEGGGRFKYFLFDKDEVLTFSKQVNKKTYFSKMNFSGEPIKLHFTNFSQLLIHTFPVTAFWAAAESSQ